MSGYTIRKISELAVEYGEVFVRNVVSSFTVAAYLIAQFGKNFRAGDSAISGVELLSFAMNHIRRAQEEVGGQIVFLEMEHGNSKLASFYGKCGFTQFGGRKTIENGKPITYDQLFLFLK